MAFLLALEALDLLLLRLGRATRFLAISFALHIGNICFLNNDVRLHSHLPLHDHRIELLEHKRSWPNCSSQGHDETIELWGRTHKHYRAKSSDLSAIAIGAI